MEDRQQTGVRLTRRSRAGWAGLKKSDGCSFNSIIEVLGEELAAGKWRPTARVIRKANALDATSSQRRRSGRA